MENVNCLLCGNAEGTVRYRGHDRLHGGPGEFTLVECGRCGFVYLSPRPDPSELSRYYPADYLSFRSALTDERSAFRRFERLFGLHLRCQAVLGFRSRGSLLDVGCGTGDFLLAMRAYRGWRVRGLEPHPVAAAQARARYGLDVDQAYLDDAAYPPESFDAVTLWDVLEHVPSPRKTLGIIQRILRPGGIVVFGVPNRDSFDAKLFGPHWAGLDVPRHFSVFSASHALAAVRGAGFGEARVLNLNGGYHSFVLSLQFLLGEGRARAPVRRALLAMARSLPARVALLPYFRLVKQLRRGSTMIVVATKA